MTFLDPLVLLGLAAAAIPVLLHLLNLRRPKKVDFSSLAFVKELQKSTMQRVKIKQWLLLLLRILAVASLVMAFARPTLTGSAAGTVGARVPTSAALVIDNSLSMTLRDGQGQYLAQAKELAAGIAEDLQEGDEAFIVTTAGEAGSAAPYRGRIAAQEALAEIETAPGAVPLSRAAARAARLLDEEATHPNRVLYLLSDAQASTLADSLAAVLPENVPVRLLPIGERAHANVAVTEVEVESRIVEAGQPVQIAATLRNFSDETLSSYVASLFLGETRVAQATAEALPAGASAVVRFTATPQQRGWLPGRVEIEGDDFEGDDVRFFALHVPRVRRVLIVQGEGERTDYVELALSSELTEGRVAFDAETIPEGRLPGTALSAYDAVVLVGPRDLSSGERSALQRYVEGGGGLLFFPNARPQAAEYDALFEALGGGAVTGFSGTRGGERPVASFERVDLEHPLFEGVFDEGREEATLEEPSVTYAMDYAPRSGTEQTLIELSNGRPFLQEIRHGRGAAFVMAVAPDLAWSDLPTRGLFVPLLYRALYYLTAGESVAGEGLVAGRPGELRIAGAPPGEPLRLVGPDGTETTPEQAERFGAVLLETDASLRAPGVYDVVAGDSLVRRVALNPDRAESDLSTLVPDEAAERLGDALGQSVQVFRAGEGGAQGVAEALRTERAGLEIWNVFLLLALGFLVAEMLVARQWQPEAT